MPNDKNRAAQGESGLSSFRANGTGGRDGFDAAASETQLPIVEPSWDPYQVWLTRVKQPREDLRRRQRSTPGDKPIKVDTSETARLRALSTALPR